VYGFTLITNNHNHSKTTLFPEGIFICDADCKPAPAYMVHLHRGKARPAPVCAPALQWSENKINGKNDLI
jgi:hypothetical protein